MTTSTCRDLGSILEALSAVHPNMRLGQLVCNLASLVSLAPDAVLTVTNDALRTAGESHLDQPLRRLQIAEPPIIQDVTRVDLLAAIGSLIERESDITLGQLLSALVLTKNCSFTTSQPAARIWDIEDVDLLKVARQVLAKPAPMSLRSTNLS